jgi:hypothetical protein
MFLEQEEDRREELSRGLDVEASTSVKKLDRGCLRGEENALSRNGVTFWRGIDIQEIDNVANLYFLTLLEMSSQV